MNVPSLGYLDPRKSSRSILNFDRPPSAAQSVAAETYASEERRHLTRILIRHGANVRLFKEAFCRIETGVNDADNVSLGCLLLTYHCVATYPSIYLSIYIPLDSIHKGRNDKRLANPCTWAPPPCHSRPPPETPVGVKTIEGYTACQVPRVAW